MASDLLRDLTLGDKITEKIIEEYANRYKRVYRHPGKGLLPWIADNVRIENKAKGEWVPISLYDWQEKEFKEAMRVGSDGLMQYLYVYWCWPRGEGKSFMSWMMALDRLFNWKNQKILIASASKTNADFLHLNEMTDIIKNSPMLVHLIEKENLQEQGLYFPKRTNFVEPVSTYTGIKSGVNMVVFTELHELPATKEKFFTDLCNSTRAVPNAQIVTDSTASDEGHILHRQFKISRSSLPAAASIYFSYMCDDHRNPLVTRKYLEIQKTVIPPAEYEKHFRNRWGSGGGKMFSRPMIMAGRFLGLRSEDPLHPVIIDNQAMIPILNAIEDVREEIHRLENEGMDGNSLKVYRNKIGELETKLVRVDEIYRPPATKYAILGLAKAIGCEWCNITVGLDRAMPFSKNGDRTLLSLNGRFLMGYEIDETSPTQEEIPIFWDILLDLINVEDSSEKIIKEAVARWNMELEVENFLMADYQTADIFAWAEDNAVMAEMIQENYANQVKAFTEMYQQISRYRMKHPVIGMPTLPEYDNDDEWEGNIYEVEMSVFEQFTQPKGFGSPTKSSVGGVKDDATFSRAWAKYAARDLVEADIKSMPAKVSGGTPYGKY